MNLSAFEKIIIITWITLIALYISLPKNTPVNIEVFGKNIEKTISRSDINFSVGKVKIEKNLDLLLGLDLAGGSHLVFEADTTQIDEADRSDALEALKETIERRVNLFGVSEPSIQNSSFEGKDRVIVELPGVKDTDEAVSIIGDTAQLVFATLGDEENPAINETELTGSNLKKADVVFDQTSGEPAVSLEFDADGSEKFSNITKENIGKPVAILIDGQLVSAPIVNQQISGGTAQITGGFTVEQADNLAIQLNSGALPVSVKLVEERTVGATLGKESIQKSVQAGLIGLGAVLMFMIIIYGRLGIIASIGLVVFGILTLATYKMVPVVLTLPGVAGFLLSVGMAVDSNILIFERFKEEKNNHPFSDALEISFGRAWDSIRDANVATLITAFILANPFNWPFLHTSGPVRGFAITLAFGILVSLFTGVVVTRNLLRVFIKEKK
ncbi:protein translocase subunit SecD [Patescibacteria group bacterium]